MSGKLVEQTPRMGQDLQDLKTPVILPTLEEVKKSYADAAAGARKRETLTTACDLVLRGLSPDKMPLNLNDASKIASWVKEIASGLGSGREGFKNDLLAKAAAIEKGVASYRECLRSLNQISNSKDPKSLYAPIFQYPNLHKTDTEPGSRFASEIIRGMPVGSLDSLSKTPPLENKLLNFKMDFTSVPYCADAALRALNHFLDENQSALALGDELATRLATTPAASVISLRGMDQAKSLLSERNAPLILLAAAMSEVVAAAKVGKKVDSDDIAKLHSAFKQLQSTQSLTGLDSVVQSLGALGFAVALTEMNDKPGQNFLKSHFDRFI